MVPTIRKAVIPAAGLGTRFLPATKVQPKEMLPIVDKPVIQFVVEEAIASGIDDIIIVTGRGKRTIEDYFDLSPELEAHLANSRKHEQLEKIRAISTLADIHYIRQKEPKGLGDAVLKAEKHVGMEPFAVLLGDDIIRSAVPCTRQLINLFETCQSPIIAVASGRTVRGPALLHERLQNCGRRSGWLGVCRHRAGPVGFEADPTGVAIRPQSRDLAVPIDAARPSSHQPGTWSRTVQSLACTCTIREGEMRRYPLRVRSLAGNQRIAPGSQTTFR